MGRAASAHMSVSYKRTGVLALQSVTCYHCHMSALKYLPVIALHVVTLHLHLCQV